MPSDPPITSDPTTAFVWIWLPERSVPVVTGRLDQVGDAIVFRYGQSYMEREDRIPIYEPELPLIAGEQLPKGEIHGCIADAGPDAWGQRVIEYRRFGTRSADGSIDLGRLGYLLGSGSDRIGGLDFQETADDYLAREADVASLDDLALVTEKVEEGAPLPESLSEALLRGTSIGGARPKALLEDRGRKLIAKFSSTTDVFPIVQAEFLAMRLASLAGIDAAKTEMTEALGKHVMLSERFDRPSDGTRRLMVSALTVLGLTEAEARYASYADLAHVIRARFTDPDATLRGLFSRITFNILCSNTDDHARNQAAFWDGSQLTLTPAYDICPFPRAGGEASQVMAIGEDGWRFSQLAGCVRRSATYHLTRVVAQELIDHQVDVIRKNWGQVCDEARLTQVQREALMGAQFLNPFAFLDSHS